MMTIKLSFIIFIYDGKVCVFVVFHSLHRRRVNLKCDRYSKRKSVSTVVTTVVPRPVPYYYPLLRFHCSSYFKNS